MILEGCRCWDFWSSASGVTTRVRRLAGMPGAAHAANEPGAMEAGRVRQEDAVMSRESQAQTAVSTPDDHIEDVARRLERIARSLREKGVPGPLASNDPLGALITGYLLGLGASAEERKGRSA